ncbi:MAG: endonuclease MutS2 [Clostridiaceae bacterium]|nr:endonuclease MutS2 [Clostridiaceae bacterium]
MREKTLKNLEYNTIIELVAERALTLPGRMLCSALLPAHTALESESWLTETEDAVARLLKYGDLPFAGINDIRPAVRQAAVGAVLSCADLLRIAAFLRAVERMLAEVTGNREGQDDDLAVHQKAKRLEAFPGFLKRLEQSIAGEDELFDRASDTLFSIRKKQRDAQDAVRRELDRVLVKHADALQETIITIRGGRYVVPVRSDRRAAVRGLVHDTSSTGNTLFVEPMAVVELNNKIRELEAAEQHEVLVILKELSGIVSTQHDALLENTVILAELDFAMAKARYALAIDATRPALNEHGIIVLRRARHPLIARDQVVAIDFELGKTFRTLVITGPNTGGKTVTLKTCGLLTLMAMAGLFIPVASGSHVSWFGNVEVDIGDEQSIEQSLSTFSSHMREIVRITENAGEGTLVLLDELGAGTDPSEGAALAIAILDHLKASGCHTVATTHYRELKGYAMNEPDVENACCEFDTETLSPTYKLLIGVPGVSNAFVISSRLGLSPRIIDSARALITEEGTRFEDLISAIERSHREARTMEEEIERLRLETKKAQQALDLEVEKIGVEHDRLLAKAREEANELLSETRTEVDELLSQMRQQTSGAKSSDHRIASDMLGRLGSIEKKFRLRSSASNLNEDKILLPEEIVEGERYEARSLGVSGIVRGQPDAKNQVVLESGSFRVKVPISELRRSRKKKDAPAKRRASSLESASVLRSDIVMRAGTELMLLGKRVDEALTMIDHFLDEAMLAGLSPIRIVHGKGTGALREATHNALARDKRRVLTFRSGGDGEGGDGVTVVDLNLS